jgi:hypothetical protein
MHSATFIGIYGPSGVTAFEAVLRGAVVRGLDTGAPEKRRKKGISGCKVQAGVTTRYGVVVGGSDRVDSTRQYGSRDKFVRFCGRLDAACCIHDDDGFGAG